MPPRKRAAAAPKDTTPADEPLMPDPTEEDGAATDASNPRDETDTDGDTQTPNTDPPDEPTTGEQPCTQCWPAGWPEGATSLGCGHGSWNRDL